MFWAELTIKADANASAIYNLINSQTLLRVDISYILLPLFRSMLVPDGGEAPEETTSIDDLQVVVIVEPR